MTYVITSPCVDVKDGACQRVCPVECIYEGGHMMYIQPQACIDCGVCIPVCPVQAIFAEAEVPGEEELFVAANAEFFGPEVTGWGMPGRADARPVSSLDAPLVRDFVSSKRD